MLLAEDHSFSLLVPLLPLVLLVLLVLLLASAGASAGAGADAGADSAVKPSCIYLKIHLLKFVFIFEKTHDW